MCVGGWNVCVCVYMCMYVCVCMWHVSIWEYVPVFICECKWLWILAFLWSQGLFGSVSARLAHEYRSLGEFWGSEIRLSSSCGEHLYSSSLPIFRNLFCDILLLCSPVLRSVWLIFSECFAVFFIMNFVEMEYSWTMFPDIPGRVLFTRDGDDWIHLSFSGIFCTVFFLSLYFLSFLYGSYILCSPHSTVIWILYNCWDSFKNHPSASISLIIREWSGL